MSTARLLIAAAVLAGLGGLVWWSNKQEAAKVGQADPKAPPKILELKEEKLRKIAIEHKGEATTVVSRDDSGKWSITEPEKLTADSGAVAALTSAASNLASDRVVDESAADLTAYGLEPPALAVTFTLDDGSTKRLRIGETTADGMATYASLDGDKRLFTMVSSNKASFDKHAIDLREKHLLTFDADKLTSVELSVPGKPAIQFGKTGENIWQIVKPRPMRADGFQVDEMVRVVKDAQMDVNTDPKAAATKFASGRPAATVKFTLPDNALGFELRESGGEFFAKSSMLDGAYKVPLDVSKGLSKNVEEFRSKKLLDMGFDEPSKIEVTDKGVTRVIEKSGENWVSSGKTMDSLSVQNLVDKLRDLSAATFDDAKFTSTEMKLVVTSKGGQRVETVEISAANNGFAARRADGTTIYRLDTQPIADLRQAIDGVREPPPPAAEKDAKSGKNK